MALAKVKTAEEMARLDAIYAEIESAGYNTDGSVKIEEKPKLSPEQRLECQDVKQIVSNAKGMLRDNAFKTKWENVLAKTLLKVFEQGCFIPSNEFGALNTELNILRNFAQGVSQRLEKTERSAREQDNHHYYKIFADGVKTLLEAL